MPYSSIEAKPIGYLCRIIDCEHKTAPYVEKSEFLVVRTSNVRDGQLVMDDMKYTTEAGYAEWTQRAVPEHGDVLFTREAPAGETCLVPPAKKVCMGQRMVLLRPKRDVVDPFFLSQILATEKTKFTIRRLSIGSTVSRINISDIKTLRVAAPHLPEQKKIAQILSTWDQAISATEHLLENSQQRKKGLMQQLLTGKKRLPGFEGEWKEGHLKDISAISKGKALSSKDLEYGTYPVVAGGKTSPYTHKSYTHDHAITVSASGAYAGYVAYHEYKFWASDCSVVEPTEASDIEFLCHLMTWNQKRIYSLQSGGAQPHIYPKDIKSVRVKIPVKDEQQAIANVITTETRQIDLLKNQLDRFKQEKKALMQQLLTGKRRAKVDAEFA